MNMTRRDDWRVRLTSVARDWRVKPYIYGQTDCACFVQAAVEAVTGVVLLEAVEKPSGMMESARFLISRGWRNVEGMAEALLGASVEPDLSRAGDVVSFFEGGEPHLAVRVGDLALSPSATGLNVIVRKQWRRAWQVG